MNKTNSIIIFFLLLLSIQSCSYHWSKYELTNGEKLWVRSYKDYQKQEHYEDKLIFKNRKSDQAYQKYSGIITSDTTHGSTFIQFDSVRVYLFGDAYKFKSVFTSGLISGQMLFCKMNSSCKPIKEIKITDAVTGEPIIENLWGWTGYTITIDYFEELKNIKSKPTQRKFKFWVYPYKIRFNGGNSIYLLELTNDKANKKTDMEEFIKGASVTLLMYESTMI